jgi:hypothetical protein
MQSTTGCLFDGTCLDDIGSYVHHSTVSISSFTKPNPSRFSLETTVEKLANEQLLKKGMSRSSTIGISTSVNRCFANIQIKRNIY